MSSATQNEANQANAQPSFFGGLPGFFHLTLFSVDCALYSGRLAREPVVVAHGG